MSTPPPDYTSPRTFTVKQRLLLGIVPPVAAGLLKSVDATCRHEIRGKEHWDAISSGDNRILGAFWHENLVLLLCMKRNTGFHTLTSYSFDGELAARAVNQFGMKALRGSSSEGGMSAIRQMSNHQVHAVGFTIDGPKGPRRCAKPGVAILAARTQLPILPLAVTATRSARLKSWDRLALPLFFSTIAIRYGAPIPPPADKTRASILETSKALEGRINELQAELEEEFGVDPLLSGGVST